MEKKLCTICDYLGGLVSGMAIVAVGHPMDTIKVLSQTSHTSMRESTKLIAKTSGFKGFFRGMYVPMLTQGMINTLFFGTYGTVLDYLVLKEKGLSYSRHHVVTREERYNSHFWYHFMAGMAGGAAQLILSCPIENIKTKLQSDYALRTNMTATMQAKELFHYRGIRGLYIGLIPMAFRDIIPYGYHMLIYEYIKLKMVDHNFGYNATCIIAGSISGMISWWAVIPFEVIKTKMQADDVFKPKYKSMLHCAKDIFKNHGLSGWFRGFGLLTLRAIPVNAAAFISYEAMERVCKNLCACNKKHDIDH